VRKTSRRSACAKNQKEGELMKKSGRFACVKIQDEVECGEKVTALRVCKKSMKM
jgi:hypothetical protein